MQPPFNTMRADTGGRPRACVLVIDDDPAISTVLKDALEGTGYRVLTAAGGQQARATLRTTYPDLVLLDLSLPDVHGLILCADIKADTDIPIIVLSATSQQWEATVSLRIGADDFVAKPFELDDLLARIAAVLRRAGRAHTTESWNLPRECRVGELVIDRQYRRVTLGGEEIHLSGTEFRLLSTLASKPECVYSRAELARAAWGYLEPAQGRTIDAHMRHLRVKLEGRAAPSPTIVAVRTIGYKLMPAPANTPAAVPLAA